MIEANVEVYESRAGALAVAANKEVSILHSFRTTRANLNKAKQPMTTAQKVGALGLLEAAKDARTAAAILVDEAFDATEPIEE